MPAGTHSPFLIYWYKSTLTDAAESGADLPAEMDKMEYAANVSVALLKGIGEHTTSARAMQTCCMTLWQMSADPVARRAVDGLAAAAVLAC